MALHHLPVLPRPQTKHCECGGNTHPICSNAAAHKLAAAPVGWFVRRSASLRLSTIADKGLEVSPCTATATTERVSTPSGQSSGGGSGGDAHLEGEFARIAEVQSQRRHSSPLVTRPPSLSDKECRARPRRISYRRARFATTPSRLLSAIHPRTVPAFLLPPKKTAAVFSLHPSHSASFFLFFSLLFCCQKGQHLQQSLPTSAAKSHNVCSKVVQRLHQIKVVQR